MSTRGPKRLNLKHMMMDLIPGLTHDIAVECLIRVPCSEIPRLKSVCKDWKTETELPEFYRARNFAKKAQFVVILALTKYSCHELDPSYRLVALDPETGCWWNLPPIPEVEAGYPDMCEMVASGSGWDLVVIGGRGGSEEYFDSVLVFDFPSYKWRRGANMPGGPRGFFACAGDGNGTIYVAGGHDVNNNPLKSAWAYHVSTDTWTRLPDMPQERGYCKGLFNLGKFHVMNSFAGPMQDHHQSLEIFDTSSRQWLLLGSRNDDAYHKIIKSPRYCVQGTNCKLYTVSDMHLVVLDDNGKWKSVSRLPDAVAFGQCITPFPGHLLLTSIPDLYDLYDAYILNLKDLKWTRLDVPSEHFGDSVQSAGCYLTI